MALVDPTPTASFDQSGVYKLDLSEVLSAILLDDTDFVSMIGISSEYATQTKHQWVEDALNATTITQTGGNSFLSGTTATVIAFSANISRITAGTLMKDQLSGKSEVVQVTAINGVSATVTRGYGATNGEAHVSGAVWEIVAHPRPQGMAGPKDESTTRAFKFNFTQIFSKGVNLTGTATAIEHAGISAEDDYQIDMRLRELKRELDRAVIMSVRAPNDVGASTYGTMAGIIDWTGWINTANKTTTAETLTPSVLNTMIKQVWDDGGDPDFVLVSGLQKQKISLFDQEFRRSTLDTRKAGYTVEEFVSDLGINLKVIVDRWVPDDVCIVGDSKKIKILPLKGRAFFLEKLAKTGDSDQWQIVGEYTMEVRNAAEAFAYHNTLKR